MEVLSLLETDESIVDFRKFFFYSNIDTGGDEVPVGDIFDLRDGIGPLLQQIEAVSFAERTRKPKPLGLHLIWAECTRHLIGMDRMLKLMKWILTVCYHSTGSFSENVQ